jgi:2-polyprenyl-6-methoxyphenol hydroxylase-like FAD-dependent oxidoreductase
MRAIIIGGGIGGVMAALTLQKAGIVAKVFERAAAPAEVGAGISLWGNAVRALGHVGLADEVVQTGDVLNVGEVRNSGGKVLSLMPVAQADRELGRPSVVIHRADLLDILLRRAAPQTVTFGAECVSVQRAGDQVQARFANGRAETGDLLIGADGINSVVRKQLVGPEATRYAGYTCWRGVLEYPEVKWPRGHAAECWGRGQRFGITRIGAGRVYWWATLNAPANGHDGDVQAELLRAYRGWFETVTDLIRRTPPTAILRNDIIDRIPSQRWGDGRITLLGDAAHATTPNLGQGGCMALEDGVVLAKHVARAHRRVVELPAALRAYETERYPRTTMVTKASWRLGWVGQWSNPTMCIVRDLLTSLTPAFMFRQNHRSVVGFAV